MRTALGQTMDAVDVEMEEAFCSHYLIYWYNLKRYTQRLIVETWCRVERRVAYR